MSKICCIYAFYHKTTKYALNFMHFLKHGIYPDIDYYIVINGKSPTRIPSKPNVKVLFRENKGFDFGAYHHALSTITDKEKYDYYFFLNTSVRGPFLRNNSISWTKPFLELMDSTTKLVGTSINIYPDPDRIIKTDLKTDPPYPHVQSMFFAMDKELLFFLWEKDFFVVKDDIQNLETLIIEKEIKLSLLVLSNNWNINCILEKYMGLDYRTIKEDINPSSYNGDPYYPNRYFHETIDPYDVIFFKNTRW